MIGDTILNFKDSGSSILNFGDVKEDDKVVVFYKDLQLEFPKYESLWIKFKKTFITEEKELKVARVILIDRQSDRVIKRYYGKSIPSGQDVEYAFEAVYKDYNKNLTTTQFLEQYIFRFEVHVTDPNETGEANIEELLSDLEFYLKRDKVWV